MNFRSGFTSFCAAALLAVSGSSYAFTVDFANIADTEGEAGFAAWSRTFDGVLLTATGSATDDDDANQFAYLDAGNAGLGVCKDITNALQCSPSSDDNVTLNETLTIAFDTEVTISNLTFRNGGHGTNFDGTIDITIDNQPTFTTALVHQYNTPLTGSTFTFGGVSGAGNTYQFYMSALTATETPSVPSPAPLALMGLAMVGFGWQRRLASR